MLRVKVFLKKNGVDRISNGKDDGERRKRMQNANTKERYINWISRVVLY